MRVNGKVSKFWLGIVILFSILAGCQSVPPLSLPSQTAPLGVETPLPSQTPFQPQVPTRQIVTLTPTPVPPVKLGLHPGVPQNLRQGIQPIEGMQWAAEGESADLWLVPDRSNSEGSASWVFALAAPFSTLEDEINSQTLLSLWKGEAVEGWEDEKLYLTETTRAMLERVWGEGSVDKLRIATDSHEMMKLAWGDQPALAILPFEELEPRWKVLRIDGLSPLQQEFPTEDYFLTVYFHWEGETTAAILPPLPASNRLEEKMTVITMTGVTALTRATGFMMDKFGILYPGEDIRDWMREADFTHVSNEVSFHPDCPAQDPNYVLLRFCSRPIYIDLLEDVGVDIVELTGNHLMDFRPEALPLSMEMYRERGWYTFGGGENLEIAQQPALLEHNGNAFAFVGCNPAGPGGDWAGPGNAGTQPCDWDAFRQQIRDLTAEGYLVIATLQYGESYSAIPGPQQVADFRSLSEAGAVIVSGSQAHYPQAFDFLDGKLIHHGLGNLFFDQMDYPVVGTRREFLDRHVFYEGRHVSTELLTAMLENYARPRPMTAEERMNFLRDIFKASGW